PHAAGERYQRQHTPEVHQGDDAFAPRFTVLEALAQRGRELEALLGNPLGAPHRVAGAVDDTPHALAGDDLEVVNRGWRHTAPLGLGDYRRGQRMLAPRLQCRHDAQRLLAVTGPRRRGCGRHSRGKAGLLRPRASAASVDVDLADAELALGEGAG